MYIYKKRYKDAAITLVYGVLAAFIPFVWLEGSTKSNIKLFIDAFKVHGESYADGNIGLFANTLFYEATPTTVTATALFTVLPLILAFFLRESGSRSCYFHLHFLCLPVRWSTIACYICFSRCSSSSMKKSIIPSTYSEYSYS